MNLGLSDVHAFLIIQRHLTGQSGGWTPHLVVFRFGGRDSSRIIVVLRVTPVTSFVALVCSRRSDLLRCIIFSCLLVRVFNDRLGFAAVRESSSGWIPHVPRLTALTTASLYDLILLLLARVCSACSSATSARQLFDAPWQGPGQGATVCKPGLTLLRNCSSCMRFRSACCLANSSGLSFS